MQTASCHVRLGGDVQNTVFKQEVTPAEILLLRGIHGQDAVVDIQFTGSDKRPHVEERDRLFRTYGEAKTQKGEPIFMLIFPSPLTPMPVSFRDIGMDMDGNEVPEKPKRAPKAPEQPPAAPPVAENPGTPAADGPPSPVRPPLFGGPAPAPVASAAAETQS
jgi:hypothetical protein